MSLDIQADEFDAGANRHGRIELSIRGFSTREVLDHFDATDIVGHFDSDELLKEIGKDACKAYFDLKDNDE